MDHAHAGNCSSVARQRSAPADSTMAETSDHLAQAPGEPDEPEPEPEPLLVDPVRPSSDRNRDAREDTELARLRLNYSRASSYRAQSSSTRSKKPSNLLERFTYSILQYWRHQISITVEHSTCRDHLGTFLRFLLSHSYPPDRVSNLAPA
jgi:hypothetical protein